jgi:hypothetical protein
VDTKIITLRFILGAVRRLIPVSLFEGHIYKASDQRILQNGLRSIRHRRRILKKKESTHLQITPVLRTADEDNR